MQTSSLRDAAGLRRALASARPGTQLLLEPGEYGGGFFSDLHGAPGKPIVLRAADPARPPRFGQGGVGLQLSRVSYIELHDLMIVGAQSNGLNIDDGGGSGKPSHHVTLRNLRVSELPRGNHDAIKLSGVEHFVVEQCQLARWGGSGIDMVGCHHGTIRGCVFREGGDNGVQAKGGSAQITVQRCRFENAGSRAINLGGSTGLAFFRPPVAQMPPQGAYEARELRVEGCTFTGSDAPLAFVGVDGAVVRFNTLYLPRRWALRILQETRQPEFAPTRRGVIEDNLVVFSSSGWSEGGVNIGPGTAPESFRFARNFWYCIDRPDRSRPQLPTRESEGVYGRDPLLTPTLTVAAESPARSVGAHAFRGASE